MLCHFSHVQLFVTSWNCSPSGFSVHEILQAKTTVVGYHFLLQGLFQAQGLNHVSCLLHWQVGTFPLAPPGKPSTCNFITKLS